MHSVPKSFQQSISQGNYRADIYQEGFARHAENNWSQGTFQHVLQVFVLTLLLHGKVLYSNNHIQRVCIFIVRKSGKTDFKCILKAGYILKKYNLQILSSCLYTIDFWELH